MSPGLHETMVEKTSPDQVEISINKSQLNGTAQASDSKKSIASTHSQGPSPKVSNAIQQFASSPVKEVENFVTTKSDGAVKLRINESTSHIQPRTVISLLQQMTSLYGDRSAFRVKRNDKWLRWTYNDYLRDVKAAAKGFIQLGLRPFHGVGILGFNSPEWFMADLGAIAAQGLAVGIYTTNSPEACQYVLSNGKCDILVLEDEKYLDRIYEVKDKLPELKAIVVYNAKNNDFKAKYDFDAKENFLYTWQEFMLAGKDISDEEINKRIDSLYANQCCTIIYTSGTTGNPKGAMLSHDNITYTSSVACEESDLKADPKEIFVSYLPLSHIAAQICDIYLPIVTAGEVVFAKPDAMKGSLLETLQDARPTALLGVPRVWEKIEDKLKTIGAQSPGIVRMISSWAKGVGLKANIARIEHRSAPKTYGIAKALVFNKVRKRLGLDRCKMTAAGAAPLMKETLEYFFSLDIPIYEIYGMSETTGPHCLCRDGQQKVCSVGKPIGGFASKLINVDQDGAGELCLTGRHIFMGYLEMEQKTKDTFDENQEWLMTGDIAKIDDEGYIYITGRLKELIITGGGENVAPVLIEDAIKDSCSELISNAFLLGDKQKFLSVLLSFRTVMDEEGAPTDKLDERARKFIKQKTGEDITTVKDAYASEKIKKLMEGALEEANKLAPSRAQKVQKFDFLRQDFSIAGGELGPTMKVKRPVVAKMYTDLIAKIYAV